MTYDAGEHPVARRRPPVPTLPRRYEVRVAGRVVASLSLETGGDIVPGSVVWHADPCGVTGAERYEAAWNTVRDAGLDPKADLETVYDALWSQAPRKT